MPSLNLAAPSKKPRAQDQNLKIRTYNYPSGLPAHLHSNKSTIRHPQHPNEYPILSIDKWDISGAHPARRIQRAFGAPNPKRPKM